MIADKWSTAFSRYSEPGHRGQTYQNVMESGKVWQRRFDRWQKAQIGQPILESLQAEADQLGKLDWEVHFVDGSVIRAHQHAAGGKKGAKQRKN